MNSPPDAPQVTVYLPVTFTYNPEGLLWFIASAQTPEVREARCLAAARDMFSQCLAWVNGEKDGKPPEHLRDVVITIEPPERSGV